MSMSCSSAACASSSASPQAHWITPQEQLTRLALPMAKELVNQNRDKFQLSFGAPIEEPIIESVARSILRRSGISEDSEKILSLMDLCVEHLVESSPLPPHLTTWYKALNRIHKLPEKIPPLPASIHQTFEENCPRQICSYTKSDGTCYKIKETCTLILIPQELGNPDEFEKVVKAYGENHYPEGENPLHYQDFQGPDRQQYGEIPFGPTCWILHTDDVLEESREESWDHQVRLVDALAQETFVNWEVPESFYETFLTIALTEIGTRKKLYQIENAQGLSTYTRVKQTTQGDHLVVGGSSPNGVNIFHCYNNSGSDGIGIAARRKF